MNALFLGYDGCSTCKKAKAWLSQQGVAFEPRPIRENPPTVQELRKWIPASSLPVKKWLNTSGQSYRNLNLKETLPQLSEEELLGLMAGDGMLVKRPVLVLENRVLVGFRSQVWRQALDEA